jgi:hypothetical protein
MFKRGQVGEMIEWIPRLVVLLVAVIIVALLVRHYADRDVDAAATHRAAYLARLEYDPKFLAWEDPVTGRVTPGVIDATKLTPDRINQAYGVTGAIASKINVSGSCIPPFGDYHDKVTFDRFVPFALLELKGAGGATMERWSIPVTIVGAERCPGIMTIAVVTPNTPPKEDTQ